MDVKEKRDSIHYCVQSHDLPIVRRSQVLVRVATIQDNQDLSRINQVRCRVIPEPLDQDHIVPVHAVVVVLATVVLFNQTRVACTNHLQNAKVLHHEVVAVDLVRTNVVVIIIIKSTNELLQSIESISITKTLQRKMANNRYTTIIHWPINQQQIRIKKFAKIHAFLHIHRLKIQSRI